MIHQPVLLNEVLIGLRPVLKPGSIFVDATVGAGGHSLALLENCPDIKLIGIDQDENILNIAKDNLVKYKDQISLVHDNFSNIKEILGDLNIKQVSAILADIGVSSLQLDQGDRGFSFKFDAPLDMRMDQNQSLTAELIIKTWNESKIASILWQYGEERFANKIAKAIVSNRRSINTTTDLARIVEENVPKRFNKFKIHPATKTFQALRIAVNNEIDYLETFLDQAPELLVPGGRLAIISFHSLEDRLVKTCFSKLKLSGKYEIHNKGVITATAQEVAQNRRSRSAKLRFISHNY
jgi:16S rRNA (cytosine1402-N4)-methyltransferase